MRIRLIIQYRGWRKGDEVEIDARIGNGLICHGVAEAIQHDKPKPKGPATVLVVPDELKERTPSPLLDHEGNPIDDGSTNTNDEGTDAELDAIDA